jgi:hypothetical protein
MKGGEPNDLSLLKKNYDITKFYTGPWTCELLVIKVINIHVASSQGT